MCPTTRDAAAGHCRDRRADRPSKPELRHAVRSRHAGTRRAGGRAADGLPGVVVFGCTTAGQITPRGYEDTALVALAFQRDHFRVASKLFKPVAPVSIAEVVTQTERLTARFPVTPGRRQLALIFVDGLSMQEDILVAALEAGLKDIPVFGGSAGDGLAFARTHVLHGGEFHTNAALLLAAGNRSGVSRPGVRSFRTDRQAHGGDPRRARGTTGAGDQRHAGSTGIRPAGRRRGRRPVADHLRRKPGAGAQSPPVPCPRDPADSRGRRADLPVGHRRRPASDAGARQGDHRHARCRTCRL